MNVVNEIVIKVRHLEPNNIYPNSKEVYEIEIPEKGFKETFVFRLSDSGESKELGLRSLFSDTFDVVKKVM